YTLVPYTTLFRSGQFALEVIETDDRGAIEGFADDVLLERRQGRLELVHDRQVVVDDLVEHRVQAERGAQRQQPRITLHPCARRRIRQRGAVSHRDQVARSEKQVGFAIGDFLRHHLRGAGGQEQRVAIGLDLRPL